MYRPVIGQRFVALSPGGWALPIRRCEFYLVADPCQPVEISEVRLVVFESGTTEPTKFVVLRVEFRDPIPIAELLVSLDPAASNDNEVRTVLDANTLDRFRHDETYLTSVQDPFYFATEFFDAAGVEYRMGSQLAARFSIPNGMIGLASGDYTTSAKCENGSPGWNLDTSDA